MNSPDQPLTPLAGVRVLEIDPADASAYAGLLFAQAGASVMTVTTAPSSAHEQEPDLVQWSRIRAAYLNDGKSSMTLSEGAEVADANLARLALEHDIIIGGPGFDWQRLALPAEGRQITVEVTPFGRDGPRAHWAADELVLAALGSATEFTLDEHATPVGGYGRRYQYMAGTYAFDAAVAMLLSGGATEGGAHPTVGVSVLETVVSMLGYSTTQYAYNGATSIVGQAGPRYTLRCTDGFIVLGANGSWPALAALLERPDLADDPRFLTQGARYAHVAELGEMVAAWAAQYSIAQAAALAEARSVAVIGVADGAALLADVHLADRDAWEAVRVPGLGEGRAPRPAYIFDGQRVGRTRHDA